MKFMIETYGCQMNVADSELISSILIKAGYTQVNSVYDADIIIFNTCSVRENAETRVIGRISSVASPNNGHLLIGIVGCMAQRLGEQLKKINKKIDFVVGVDQYSQLPEIIENSHRKNQFISNTIFNHSENYNYFIPTRTNETNAFVTIMRGCNNFCTYCIVPYTRGRERSRPIKEILHEIEQAGKNKIYDITLLGQNVNSYMYENNDFPDLLTEINKIDCIKRIRFVTSHPKDLSDKLINVMANSEKVCEHIHLPLQSGNNDILSRMNRNYTAEHYLNLVSKLRNAMPNIAITTDVIAGFPGETEEQFIDTLNIMNEVKFDFAYMFKYSERSGTKATELDDQVPEVVRLERLQRLIEAQTEITTEKYKSRIGTTEEIYVESVSKRNPNEMSGKTRDFKITVFDGDESMINTFVKVKINEAAGWTLKGNIVRDMSLIVAVDENFGIGKNNDLLIRIKEDMKRFKRLTTNNIVVMGRKTFESLPDKKPLKNRTNIVLTNDINYKIEGVITCNSVDDVLKICKEYNKDVFIIGGEMIYSLFLPYSNKVYITKIYKKFEADKHFPSLNNSWKIIEESEMKTTDDGVNYQFFIYGGN